MFVKKNIFILFIGILFVAPILYAQELPTNKGDIQQWEKETFEFATNWRNYIGKNKEYAQKIIIEFNETLTQNSERPKLWVILGQLHGYEAGFIVEELKKSGVSLEEIRKNSEYLEALEKVNESFKEALELNSGELTLNDLMRINTVITKADIKIASLKEMLRLYGEGQDFENMGGDPVTNFEYNTHAKMVTAYIDEKRYEEALSVIDEIEKKFPYMNSEIELGRKQITGYIQAAVDSSQQDQENKTKPTKPKKPESVTTMDKQQPVVKEKDEQQSYENLLNLNNSKTFVISITLVLLLLVAFIAVRRKNNK